MGRYTHINSDGYIDRAFSKLNSYNFTALYEEGKQEFVNGFRRKRKNVSGVERNRPENLGNDPKFNYSGAIYDSNWGNIIGFYDNETDNYRQNHYQLLWEQKFNESGI
jgi:iron complex outermembrane receptor protein